MNEMTKAHLKRLLACLLGGVVLAIMIGPQEGTLTDFGISFHDAVLKPRIALFLAIGVLIYLMITFWPLVRPHIRRPGVVPAVSGLVIVLVSQAVMNWYDPLLNLNSTSAKFNKLSDVVDKTSGSTRRRSGSSHSGARGPWSRSPCSAPQRASSSGSGRPATSPRPPVSRARRWPG